MINIDEITGFLIIWENHDNIELNIMLSADGTIRRMGTGIAGHKEHHEFIGRTATSIFNELKSAFQKDMLPFFDKAIDMTGEQVSFSGLGVMVKIKDVATGKQFVYGVVSEASSSEFAAFVTKSVQLTDPWYAEQQEIAAAAKPEKKPWWRFW